MESSARGMAMIMLENVSYWWEDGEIALNNINLEVKEGQFVLISGRSGSGKSTLGSTINGLIPHYYNGKIRGKVYVDGKDMSKIPLHEIGHLVGTVFQDPRSQFFTTTTDEEIAFGLQTICKTKEEIIKRVEKVYKDLGIEELKEKSVFELSSGQKQKIAIASIYAMKPKVLILDEPSANLDMKATFDLYKVLKKLKEKAKSANAVYLASDQDREGEAIAWHISNYIKQPDKVKRIEFNEITKTAVNNAIKNPRDINDNLVNAQQARRLLDRIVGYKISPLLWKIINRNASAGRVQSVALKLICDLEDEINAFVPQKYWEVSALIEKDINLNLVKIADEKVDKIFDEKVIKKLKKDLKNESLTLEKIEVKKKSQRPPLVFKTSTLQQLASSYLGYGASKTMRIAQQLYEGLAINGENKGLITYMRTDSTRISVDALNMAKDYITKNYGEKYVGKYIVKNSK